MWRPVRWVKWVLSVVLGAAVLALFPTTCELVAAPQDCVCPYQGDFDANSERNAIDLNHLIDVLFFAAGDIQDPGCPATRGDVNASGFTDAVDLNGLIEHLFYGGTAPADPCGPVGTLKTHTSCKTFGMAADADTIPPTLECVEYVYDPIVGDVALKHINTTFNCCPTYLLATFEFTGDLIIVREDENLDDGGCDCLCLFDVEYTLTGLAPGVYTMRVYGKYLRGELPVEITLNLTQASSGQVCVEREGYPWE